MIQPNQILEWLIKQPSEAEWFEFKANYHSVEEIGERLSALSNTASIFKQPFGYLVFGVEDATHRILGTTFNPSTTKKGNELIESWITQRLSPKIDFRVHSFENNGKSIVLFEIPAASGQPVSFSHEPYIRIGSTTRKLKDFPEKQRKIWTSNPDLVFAKEIALAGQDAVKIIDKLDTQAYFEQLGIPYPTSRDGAIEKFISERFIVENKGLFDITNLGAILYAKRLNDFQYISRKAPRVILYAGKDKLKTLRDQTGTRGYAIAFKPLIDYILSQLPENEVISKAIRQTISMYPDAAIRELVANSLIHQDFTERGIGPMIELFKDRIEITSPGLPLIQPLRFIDEYQSRNEELASFMRRIGICEERGSGIDNVISLCEGYQLPAPDFRETTRQTKVILYAPKTFSEMDKQDKIRACYQHCCLKYVSNDLMTNQSLRERFQIHERNASMVSRVISDTIDGNLIKSGNPESKSKKYPKYIPIWA